MTAGSDGLGRQGLCDRIGANTRHLRHARTPLTPSHMPHGAVSNKNLTRALALGHAHRGLTNFDDQERPGETLPVGRYLVPLPRPQPSHRRPPPTPTRRRAIRPPHATSSRELPQHPPERSHKCTPCPRHRLSIGTRALRPRRATPLVVQRGAHAVAATRATPQTHT
jgi:hypothetical protein